jgi:hypothetical protein
VTLIKAFDSRTDVLSCTVHVAIMVIVTMLTVTLNSMCREMSSFSKPFNF